MTDNSLTINKKIELEKFNFSDPRAVFIDSQDDQISIVQFWRVLQKRRWLVLGQSHRHISRRNRSVFYSSQTL